MHYVNLSTSKIDLKSFTKNLYEKDDYADFDLNPSFLEDSSCSENQFKSAFKHESDADSKGSYAEHSLKDCLIKQKYRVRPGAHDVVSYNDRRIKANHRYSSWFLMCVENPDASNDYFLK